MDGISSGGGRSSSHVVVLAATNDKDSIDAALLRPGRLEVVVSIPYPSPDDYGDIMRVVMAGMAMEEEEVVGEVEEEVCRRMRSTSSNSGSVSGADIVAVCREAAMEAMREWMSSSSSSGGGGGGGSSSSSSSSSSSNKVGIGKRHLMKALDILGY